MLTPTLLALLPAFPATQQTLFVDSTDQYGVGFQHFDYAFAYAMGGGVAWIDFDNDGDEDLFCANTDGRHELFRNDGAPTFTPVAPSSGLISPLVTGTIAAVAADYDGDGWIDLYLPSTSVNRLMQNQGDGTFVDRAAVDGADSSYWSSSASFADFDRDGDLDVYVGNYVDVLNFPYHYGAPNQFYENLGSAAPKRFVERAAELGVDDTAVFGPTVPGYPYLSPEGQATAGCTLSICTLDADEDGDPDLMVGNDFGEWVTPDKYYRNDSDAQNGLAFTDVSTATGFDQRPHYNMGIAGADYDHDGDWDFYKSNLGDNLLLRNDGGLFTDVVYQAGPVSGLNEDGSKLLSSWAFSWSDFDLDLDEDLYVVNGLIPAASFILNDSRAENDLHLNQGDGTFVRVDPAVSGAGDDGAGRGLGVCDVNRDGFLDLYVMNNGALGVGQQGDRCRLYIADPAALDPSGQRSAVQLRLRGTVSPWEAIGARLVADVAGEELRRQVLADPVFVSSSSREVHFGLGTAPELERVRIDWPAGTHQELVGVPGGAQLEVFEPQVLVADFAPLLTGVGTAPALQLLVQVENTTGAPRGVVVYFDLRIGAGGPPLLQQVLTDTVAAGSSGNVGFTLPVDPALLALASGLGLELDARAYVASGGAIDSRRRVDPVP